MTLSLFRSWAHLFRESADRLRLLLLLGSAVIAISVGFIFVPPTAARKLIAAGGYYYIFAIFFFFLAFAGRVARTRRETLCRWSRCPGWGGIVVILASVFAIWSDPFHHKILFDEYVLQGTAYHMHATKEIGTVIRAYDVAGTWLPVDTFLDKRPYFFAFLVSLVHDLTGYRLANVFFVNVAFAPLFFGCVYWLGTQLAGRGPAALAVLLLATTPLLGQQVSGAGMELHNLTMLVGVIVAAVLFLRQPDVDRLGLLLFGTVLLAQSRYESVVFVVPTAIIIIEGWRRTGRALLTWPVIVAPLLLVPYAWHNRVLSATPLLWQLQEGQTSRFSLDYLTANLEGAWTFFFNTGADLANSWYLSFLGAIAGFCLLVRAWRWSRTSGCRVELSAELLSLVVFGAGIGLNLSLLMFYYWSRLDDVIASRFALPAYLLLALMSAIVVKSVRWWGISGLSVASAGLGLWILGWGLPVIARHTYTSQNLVMQELEWEHEELLRRQGPLLFVSNKSTIPFVLWRIPTIINGVGRQRLEQIKFHLHEGTFKEVIVAQALRPTTPQGDMGVDPEDAMPDNFHLETIAEKRFGARWARLSRLVVTESVETKLVETFTPSSPPPQIAVVGHGLTQKAPAP